MSVLLMGQLQETKQQWYLNFNSWFGFIQGSLKDDGKGFINNLFDITYMHDVLLG